MKLIEFSIRRPVTITILVTVVLILGFFTYSRLSVDLYPDMEIPVVAVRLSQRCRSARGGKRGH